MRLWPLRAGLFGLGCGPAKAWRGEVIPAHFVDSRLEKFLDEWVHAFVCEACDTQLVDIESCHVAVIENKWMA